MPELNIQFQVYGDAVPQGSKKGFVVKDKQTQKPRAVIVDDNPDGLSAWRRDVKAAARVAMAKRPAHDGPVKVVIDFVMMKPKSVKRFWPSVKPDGDKLERAIFDSLTKIVVTDDARIVDCHWRKRYADGEPYVLIGVSSYDAS